jgi:hypothetical protein
MHLVPRRRVLGAALAIVTGLTVLPQPASAATAVALSVPAPTGPHHVGATVLDLKDTSRADPWVPTDPLRELMVTMWYPIDVNHGSTIQYETPAESEGYVAGKQLEDYLSPDSLSEVPTHAYLDAPPAGRPHSLPLIVLSPGYTGQRSSLTSLAEDLASHGYGVAAIDHTTRHTRSSSRTAGSPPAPPARSTTTGTPSSRNSSRCTRPTSRSY